MREVILIIGLIGLAYYSYTLHKDVESLGEVAETVDIVTRELEKARERIEELDAQLAEAEQAAEEEQLEQEAEADTAYDREQDAAKLNVLLDRRDDILAKAQRNRDRLRQQQIEISNRRDELVAMKYKYGSFRYTPGTLSTESQQRAAFEQDKANYVAQINSKLESLNQQQANLDASYKAASDSLARDQDTVESAIRAIQLK